MDSFYTDVSEKDMHYIDILRKMQDDLKHPIHSNFLVTAAVVYCDSNGVERVITGANTETCVLQSCICAERSAICQMRMAPGGYTNIHTIYITASTDRTITPGYLCREFMQEYGGPSTRILLFTNKFTKTMKDVPFKVMVGDLNADVEKHHPQVADCVVFRLGDLYPFAPLYHNVPRSELVQFAEEISSQSEKLNPSVSSTLISELLASKFPLDIAPCVKNVTVETLSSSLIALYESCVNLASESVPSDSLYSISKASGVVYFDGSYETAREDKCLEYGCSIDATVKLIPSMERSIKKGNYPAVLVVVDQFGNLCAPAASPRAWLHEYGHDHIRILVRDSSHYMDRRPCCDHVPKWTPTCSDPKWSLKLVSIADVSPVSPMIVLE